MSTDTTPRHPIGEVAAQTGVNPVTLRAWQRRFGLLNPGRTAKGHRLYSDADIELIHAILGWLERGVAISQVKAMLSDDKPAIAEQPWQPIQNALTTAVLNLNADKLNHELDQLTALYPFDLAAEQVLRPWLTGLPRQWASRPDRQPLLAWQRQQLLFYLQARVYRSQQTLPGKPALLVQLRGDPLESAITALFLSLRGVKLSQLPLESLDGCQLLDAPKLLLDLPARLGAGERQALERLATGARQLQPVGAFATLHQGSLKLEERGDE